LKTAFIVRWPAKVKADTRNKAMTQYVDVVSTLIEAAAGNPESINTGRQDAHGRTGFDGRSFLNVLLGKTKRHRDYVYGAHTTRGIINGSACYPIRSVRSERYKYIRNLNHKTVFYNVISTRPDELLQTWKEIGPVPDFISTDRQRNSTTSKKIRTSLGTLPMIPLIQR
jgi:uncharacterized sulfatase